MKRIVLCLVVIGFILGGAFPALAILAVSHDVEVRLPDGTSLTIRIYGDEHFHYKTTVDGYPVEQGSDGFFYYATQGADGRQVPGSLRAHNPGNRDAAEQAALGFTIRPAGFSRQAAVRAKARTASASFSIDWENKTPFPLTGRPKSLIVLMEFADVRFSVPEPHEAFNRMANEEGYAENGAAGSIRDYFRYNSSGKFDPDFVVVGPVTLDNPRSYYSGSGLTFRGIPEAFQKLDESGFDLRPFDNNGDGIVDNFFIYFAGHNQAESGEADATWPHASTVISMEWTYGGVRLGEYACTSELKGNSQSTEMCGIGAFCHEFSHVLGLKDAYDMDGMTDGVTAGLMSLSLMSRGNYNNGGHTPPSLNAVERHMLGWLGLEELDAGVKYYELPPISENKAYVFSTENDGEFFVLENRNTSSNPWDAQVDPADRGNGLLIYHVDRSECMVQGKTAKFRWVYSGINNVLAHPCFRLVAANGPKFYDSGARGSNMFFPGGSVYTVTEHHFTPWSGVTLENRLERIELDGDVVRFAYYDALTLADEVVLSQQEAEIEILQNLQLSATLLPEDVSNPDFYWTSSDDAVARVNAKGLVTGVGEGTARISAHSADGNAVSDCLVTVTAGEMKAYTSFGVEQRDIRIAWRETEAPKTWLVRWKKAGNEHFLTYESDTTLFIINRLEPDTEYEVEVSALVQDKETGPIIRQQFKTLPLDGEFAVLRGIREDWQEGDRFWPVVNNIQKDVRRIDWKLDGKSFPASRDLILPAGEHQLSAEITTGDGVTETIVRQITVKPIKK